MKDIVIIDALRTPTGRYDGGLAGLTAVELGEHVTRGLLARQPDLKNKIEQTIFGNVLQAGSGQNVARQISMKAGLSENVPASTINEVCGSGMKALILGKQLLQLEEAELVLVGGSESMSNAPLVKSRKAENDEPGELSMLTDGLKDAFSGESMGIIGETISEQFKVSRLEQDNFAQQSQEKALAARASGKFEDEILATADLKEDETIRANSSLEKLAALRTAFKADGTVTAGNSSPVNDGASALLLATADFAARENLIELARVLDSVEVGIAPSIMGVSPIKAISKILEKNHLTIEDIDLFEINEAFAASSVAVNRELGIPEEKVNIYGGAIALGHAIGSSGARLITTLAYALRRENKRYGIASLCIGGGLGLAVLLENPDL